MYSRLSPEKAARSPLFEAPLPVSLRQEIPARPELARRRAFAGNPRSWEQPDRAGSKPNLMVVGASGHVAQAVLQRLRKRRGEFGRLVLLDSEDTVLRNEHLDHACLEYRFVRRRLEFPAGAAAYQALLRQHQINIVLDLSDLDTLPILTATDSAGVSYVNTSLNDAKRRISDLVDRVHPTRSVGRNAPHILSSGMNPGIVNVWVWHGFRQYGAPSEIVHFEYDTSTPVTGWRPTITWSRKEFLAEAVWEPTGLIVDGYLQRLPLNSLHYREDLAPIMAPVVDLPAYPRGLLVLHEENVKLGRKLDASSRYIYAIHPETMEYLAELWRDRGRIELDDLEIADNTTVPLAGSDTVGVCMDYPDKRVYYLHSLSNDAVYGTNATCAQVAVGVDAALAALLTEPLAPRLYFASDLYDTVYSDVALKGLRVEHFVFEKRRGRLSLARYVPRMAPIPALAKHAEFTSSPC